MLGALADFECDLIVERTKAGMEVARKRGQRLDRPRKLNGAQLDHARELLDQGRSRNEVARLLKVDPATLYRGLRQRK
jgi:DNA invertase Pin-like site-specific DNA recombinase